MPRPGLRNRLRDTALIPFYFIGVARLAYQFKGLRRDGGGNEAMGLAVGRNNGGGAQRRVGYILYTTPNLKMNISFMQV